MAQRGRKSAASMATVSTIPGNRVRAPCDLTEFQTAVWNRVVDTKPSDWFTADTHDLLASYCRHVSTAAVIDQKIDEFRPEWLADDEGMDRYRKLLDMREKQTRAISALARNMRLTQQSKWQPATAHRKSDKGGKKPWELS